MKKLTFLIFLVLLFGCSKLMMSVKDRNDATRNIVLGTGEEVTVIMPTVRENLLEKIEDAGWTGERFTTSIQNEIVSELTNRGVNAKAGSSKDGNYLMIEISDFNPGSGAARVVGITGIGLSESKMGGTAVLSTKAGNRELEIKKQGQTSGVTEGGDQTSGNIHYLASALASKICNR